LGANSQSESFCLRKTSEGAAAPPSSVMKSRRFTARCLPCFRQKE
jgi:hypothetical protein